MKTFAFEQWCDRLQLPTATRDFLTRLRSSPPARRVQGRLLNVFGTPEVGSAEVGFEEIGLNINMLFPPLVPRLHALFEDVKLFLVCHTVSSLHASCYVLSSAMIQLYSILMINAVKDQLCTL